MKKILIIAIALVIFVIPFLSYAETSNLYAKSGRVVEVNRDFDFVTFIDSNGNLFSFLGAEDWEVGDWVAAIMDDMGTISIYDDRVISVTYENWE